MWTSSWALSLPKVDEVECIPKKRECHQMRKLMSLHDVELDPSYVSETPDDENNELWDIDVKMKHVNKARCSINSILERKYTRIFIIKQSNSDGSNVHFPSPFM